MNNLKHKVRINIADRDGHKERVVTGTMMLVPKRLMRMIFGEFTEVLVLTPGKTVEGIEIKEIRKGDVQNVKAE
jgi:hypothetical protein